MKEETGYFDFSKFEKIRETLDNFIDHIKTIVDSVKLGIAQFLPTPLKDYMMSSIGDIVVLGILILILYLILKAFGFAFKIILRFIYLLLIIGSAYIIYINFFYHH
jgi:hypothetical protein